MFQIPLWSGRFGQWANTISWPLVKLGELTALNNTTREFPDYDIYGLWKPWLRNNKHVVAHYSITTPKPLQLGNASSIHDQSTNTYICGKRTKDPYQRGISVLKMCSRHPNPSENISTACCPKAYELKHLERDIRAGSDSHLQDQGQIRVRSGSD